MTTFAIEQVFEKRDEYLMDVETDDICPMCGYHLSEGGYCRHCEEYVE